MANPHGYPQPGYGAPGAQPGYGAPPGQPGYGAPGAQPGNRPPGQPGYGAPGAQPGYGAPAGQPPYGGAPQPGYPGGQPAYGGQPGGGMPPPGIDPNIYQWFCSVDADHSGKITALELQQALTNANWSHFNPETCRLMIGMFDRDNNGTIDLNEFQSLWKYIQQWKTMFERTDQNRSGSIEGQELHSAFSQCGFNVSPTFVQMVIVKFDILAKRSLTLDNFIQACVMLRSLTDAFRQRDTNQTGSINVSYDDFMVMAISNKP